MAEPSNLDDFFAKKDKSKKSKGKKYVSTDVMAKQLDDTGSKNTISSVSLEKSAKNKEQSTAATTATMIAEQVLPVQPTDFETFETVLRQGEDDEWRDIEEKEVDLSGLKIQNLQIGELKDEDLDRDRSDSHSDDGDMSRGRDSRGPWKVQQAAAAVVKEPEPIKEVEPEAPKAPSVYKAPHARNPSAMPTSRPRSNKSAPEINSELDFPSLSEGPKPARSGPKKGGLDADRSSEAAKRGPKVERRYEDQQANTRPSVSIGNKYVPLSQRNLS